MILSRSLARRRIAANRVTSFRAAWGPVLFDIVVIVAVLAALWQPLLAAVAGLSLAAKMIALLLAVYLPFQIVVIISTIWAVRSRWIEEDSK